MTTATHDELLERLACACRILGRLELTRAATGHVSARDPSTGRIFIRARGPAELGVRYTQVDQVVEVDLDGRVLWDQPGLKAPLEVFIHTEIYRRRPEVMAVAHMHPPAVVACTISDIPLAPIYGAYDPRGARMAIEGIPTYPRSLLIDGPELGREFAEAMGERPACLMHGHGVTTTAGTIEDATLNVITVNELATMNQQARLLGGATPISAADQEAILALEPPGVSSELSKRSAALWRYYRALTDA